MVLDFSLMLPVPCLVLFLLSLLKLCPLFDLWNCFRTWFWISFASMILSVSLCKYFFFYLNCFSVWCYTLIWISCLWVTICYFFWSEIVVLYAPAVCISYSAWCSLHYAFTFIEFICLPHFQIWLSLLGVNIYCQNLFCFSESCRSSTCSCSLPESTLTRIPCHV